MNLKQISLLSIAILLKAGFSSNAHATTPLSKRSVCDAQGYAEMAHASETKVFIGKMAKKQLEKEGWACGEATHDILACPSIGDWNYSSGVLFELAICDTNSEPEFAFFYVVHKEGADGRMEIIGPYAIYVDRTMQNVEEAC